MGHYGLALLIPVLKRPHRVEPLIESVQAVTPEPYRLVFIASPGDSREHEAIRSVGAEMFVVDGNYARKINEAVKGTQEPLIFLGADDLRFHPGWLEAAKEKLSPPVGVVGTQDLCNRRTIAGLHSTHCLVSRDYVRQGTIDDATKLLHESYLHEFVDDEFVETAKSRGAWAFAEKSIVEHLHPSVGKAPMDSLYAGQRRRMRHGRKIFRRRSALWT